MKKVFSCILLIILSFALNSFYLKRSKFSNYSVVFLNKQWNKLHLQVKVGNKAIAEQNPTVFDGQLQRNGKTNPINYDVNCYYRIDADPDHPDGKSFKTWTSTGCSRGQDCVTEL